jgi:hypothetical protein
MEYPMVAFCPNSENERALFGITAHELGHQWFPMMVGSNERLYAWQDEGLVTFIQMAAFRQRYADDTTGFIRRTVSQFSADEWLAYLRGVGFAAGMCQGVH